MPRSLLRGSLLSNFQFSILNPRLSRMGFGFSFPNRPPFWLPLSLLVFPSPAVIPAANFWFLQTPRHYIITDPAQLPVNDVALVLGTSPRNADGSAGNPFF